MALKCTAKTGCCYLIIIQLDDVHKYLNIVRGNMGDVT